MTKKAPQALTLLEDSLPVPLRDTASKIPCYRDNHGCKIIVFPINHPNFDWLITWRCPVCKTKLDNAAGDLQGGIAAVLALVFSAQSRAKP